MPDILRTLLCRRHIAPFALAATLATWGANGGQPALDNKIVAQVGSLSVTQQEVDNELRLANVPPDRRDDQTLKAALTDVIARKYMAQQAAAAELDREPIVQLDLLRSRERVLADAYGQHELFNGKTAVSQADVDSYIRSNPDRFAKRQLYQVEQITFAPPVDSISAAAKDLRSLDQVEARLKELHVKFDRGAATLDGGSISPELLKILQARNPADIFFVHLSSNGSFFKVISVQEMPRSGEEADKVARQQLNADLARRIARQTVAAALASARYVGDYARVMATPTPDKSETPTKAGQESGPE